MPYFALLINHPTLTYQSPIAFRVLIVNLLLITIIHQDIQLIILPFIALIIFTLNITLYVA